MLIVKKDTVVLGERSTQELKDAAIKAEAKYSISIARLRNKFCLNLHYYGNNTFLYANGVKLYRFKAKDSKVKQYPLCLDNI